MSTPEPSMTTEAALLPPRPLFLALAGANVLIWAIVVVELARLVLR